MDIKSCLNCEEPIKGRSDKKFCGYNCRNEYNNRKNSDANNYIRRVNRTLRKNRSILQELNPNGKAILKKDKLLSNGFNFDYYTDTYTTKTNRTYYFCYDYGYYVDELKNECLLVVKQKYM